MLEPDDYEEPPAAHVAAAAVAAPAVAASVVAVPVEPVAEERKHFCAYCGGGVAEDFSFCPHCGKDARIAHECEHCGTRICRACAPEYRFCPGCGKALTEMAGG